MPSFQETSTKYGEYWTKFQNEGNLNIDKELDSMQADLQKIFNAATK